MGFRSHKTYDHNEGFSCCFRQWGADSHCNQLHGYALKIHIEFEARHGLDHRNWVMDFGGLKILKADLKYMFDHKLLVAEDDPMKEELLKLGQLGLAKPIVVPATGCEAFALFVYKLAVEFLKRENLLHKIRVHHVRVEEHAANGATYYGDD